MLVKVDDLILEVGNLVSLRLDDSELALEISDGVVQNLDIQQTLLVLVFTLGQGSLEDLNLLVQKGQLVISANELGSEDVTLVDNLCDFLFLDFVLVIALLNNEGQLELLHLELVDDTLQFLILLLFSVHFSLVLVGLLLLAAEFVTGLCQGGVLVLNFVFELRNLVGGDLEFTLELANFILSFNQVLGVKVTVGSDSFVQVLLGLELRLEIDVLFLELADQVLL